MDRSGLYKAIDEFSLMDDQFMSAVFDDEKTKKVGSICAR